MAKNYLQRQYYSKRVTSQVKKYYFSLTSKALLPINSSSSLRHFHLLLNILLQSLKNKCEGTFSLHLWVDLSNRIFTKLNNLVVHKVRHCHTLLPADNVVGVVGEVGEVGGFYPSKIGGFSGLSQSPPELGDLGGFYPSKIGGFSGLAISKSPRIGGFRGLLPLQNWRI